MTLISLLLGLALEHFFGALDHLRNRDWFDQYCRWLEKRCSSMRFWESPFGVLLTLGLPLLLLLLLAYILGQISILFVFILGIAVFVYSLGPDFNSLINGYADALESGDDDTARRIEETFFFEELGDDQEENEKNAIRTILLCAHEHVFGVIFWFIGLGMLGALLYCLVVRLAEKYEGIHGGYAETVQIIHQILMWPSARLQALGFALGGSLVDAIEGWRAVEGESLTISKDIVSSSGIWALQYRPEFEGEYENVEASYLNWVKEAQALANRTLIVWLTILGVMTIGGWLT